MTDNSNEKIEETKEQIENAFKQKQKQNIQQQIQQIQQQLQAITTASINTMGQKVQIERILKEQEKERHQLEGMLRAYTLLIQ